MQFVLKRVFNLKFLLKYLFGNKERESEMCYVPSMAQQYFYTFDIKTRITRKKYDLFIYGGNGLKKK